MLPSGLQKTSQLAVEKGIATERSTGYIYEMPFIGMSKEGALFKSKTFAGFIESI